ncbi:MAG: iron-containing alcohol dehydrogenase [Lentisphaerae bacterium]|nr:iron-containing alcohol dehydrogenase [Lentisphaerota bacterium]
MPYSAAIPEDIRFGYGVRFCLREFLLPGRTLFICGKHSELRIREEWNNSGIDFDIVTVSGELPLNELEDILSLVRKENYRNFIGWGGGSAVDCAKAVAALTGAPGCGADYFYRRRQLPGRDNRMILIPTTAGTGAEITSNSVICDRKTGIKQSLRGAGMTADAALCDPELLKNTPPQVMAASGFDALTQALESFISIKADSLTSQLASTAAALILNNLEKACAGNDLAALENMARASMLTGIAFAQSGLGAVHGLAHPAGSICRIPHGICCAILLLPVLRLNSEAIPERFETLARSCGFADKDKLFEFIADLQAKLSIPCNFREYGLKREDFDFIIANCRSGSMKCNPRAFSDAELAGFLEGLL